MILAVLAAALAIAASNKTDTPATTTPTLTITDVKLSDNASSQPPANAAVLPSHTSSQPLSDVHIRLIDPAADIEAEVLQYE